MLVRLLKRHFWIVGAGSGLLCCVLAARAAGNVLEAHLDDSARVPREPALLAVPPAPDPEASSQRVAATRDQDGQALLRRNMFCADCVPDEPTSAAGASADDPEPWTALPLELVATNLASRPEESFATVRDSASGAQGSYYAGSTLPGTGAIARVSATYVVFHNPETNRLERVGLLSVAQRSVPASRSASERGVRDDRSAGAGATSATGKVSPFADRVRALGDTSFEIDRSVIPELMSKPRSGGAMIMPRDGALRVTAVRKGGLAELIGLKNGDVIQTIAGLPLRNPDEMMAAYAQLQDASSIDVALVRGGTDVSLSYQLR